jgi:hypothetical protein
MITNCFFAHRYEEIKNQELMERIRAREHVKDLRRTLGKGDPKTTAFVIIHFSVYGKMIDFVHIPVEVGLTAFTIQEGIVDNYWTFVDPSKLTGWLFDYLRLNDTQVQFSSSQYLCC